MLEPTARYQWEWLIFSIPTGNPIYCVKFLYWSSKIKHNGTPRIAGQESNTDLFSAVLRIRFFLESDQDPVSSSRSDPGQLHPDPLQCLDLS